MKKVFLDDLPRFKEGKNKGGIIWSESTGCKIKFIYDNIKGEIEIINYKTKGQRLDIKYNNKYFSISTCSFLICRLGELLGIHTKLYKYKIGEIIKDETRNIKLLEQIRTSHSKDTQKGYTYKCLKCGNEDEISESALKRGCGCNVCCIPSRKTLKYYNDLWTTHSHIAKMLKYPERGYEIRYGSHETEIFICPNPNCRCEKPFVVNKIVNRGFSCPQCGDGFSYPNKFIYYFLKQLNENYETEYQPNWAFIKHSNPKLNGKKRYDFYLPNRNEIWEVHGSQHYKESFQRISNKSRNLEEEIENDKIKKQLAKENGYECIIIDARCSEINHIKNKLLELPEIKRYDLRSIDWNKCHEFACSSLVGIVCRYWRDGIRSTKEIRNITKINRTTITRYLKQGAKLGWCDYDPKLAMIETSTINGLNNGKEIIQLSLKGEYIAEFKSALEASRQLNNIHNSCISACCNGKVQTAGSFMWIYKDDYNELIKNKSTI